MLISRAKTLLKIKNMLLWYLNMKSLKYKEICPNFYYQSFNWSLNSLIAFAYKVFIVNTQIDHIFFVYGDHCRLLPRRLLKYETGSQNVGAFRTAVLHFTSFAFPFRSLGTPPKHKDFFSDFSLNSMPGSIEKWAKMLWRSRLVGNPIILAPGLHL
jgi:hypothetical protein